MRQHRINLLLYAVAAGFAAVGIGNTSAQATPLLQLYLEGGTYDESTESWVLTPPGSSGGAPFRLWAIGNTGGPGSKGTISDVKLSAVYDSEVGPITINLTPTTTGIPGNYFNGFTDPSTPDDPIPSPFGPVSDGSTPKLGDGSPLPSHDEYGAGRTWQEFLLGDFSLEDSPLTDFNGTTDDPTPENSNLVAQINVYEISVTPGPGSTEFGIHPFTIHFDLYNHVEAGNHTKFTFTPFSHDGDGEGDGTDGTVTIVPEPSAVMLLTVGGFFGLTFARRKS